MKLHHLGWVGRSSSNMADRLSRDGLVPLSEPVTDPIQRVVVQFFADHAGVIWETVAPATSVDDSPLASRLRKGGGLDHVCMELEPSDTDIVSFVEREAANGAHVVCAPVHAIALGRRVAFLLYRSGRLVEYVESRPSDLPF